jgi:hypothetical protein
MMKPKTTKNNN